MAGSRGPRPPGRSTCTWGTSTAPRSRAGGGPAAQAGARRAGAASRRRRARPAGRVRPVQREHPHAARAGKQLRARVTAAGLGDQAAGRGVSPLRRLLQELVAGLGLDVGPTGRQRMAGAHPARPAPHPRRRRGHARGGLPGRGQRASDVRRAAAAGRRAARRPARRLSRNGPGLPRRSRRRHPGQPAQLGALPRAGVAEPDRGQRASRCRRPDGAGRRASPAAERPGPRACQPAVWTKAADAVRGMWHNAAIMAGGRRRRRPTHG